MEIPVNRWTILLILGVASLFGGDFVAAVFRAITAMGSAYVPAV